MIVVDVQEQLGETWISLSGHAEGEVGVQICAAVSHAMMTLALSCNCGSWGGDKSGEMSAVVPRTHAALARFTLFGLHVLAQAYPDEVKVPKNLWNLKVMEPVRAWRRKAEQTQEKLLLPKS